MILSEEMPDFGRLLTWGAILFILSLMYFLIFVIQFLFLLDITNLSDIFSYIIPVLLMDIPFGIPFFFLMFKETGVLHDRELLIAVVFMSFVAVVAGFLYLHFAILQVAEEDPGEALSYEGNDIFVYLNPFHKNECEYGIVPEEYLDGFDECSALTSMALGVRYFIYLGPHNPVTLFIGGYILRRLMMRFS